MPATAPTILATSMGMFSRGRGPYDLDPGPVFDLAFEVPGVCVAVFVGLMRMPGTINLTPTAVTQRFWFQPAKTIKYAEVTALQTKTELASITRVVGDNGVKIVHSSKQRLAKEFCQELERRTGKRVTLGFRRS